MQSLGPQQHSLNVLQLTSTSWLRADPQQGKLLALAAAHAIMDHTIKAVNRTPRAAIPLKFSSGASLKPRVSPLYTQRNFVRNPGYIKVLPPGPKSISSQGRETSYSGPRCTRPTVANPIQACIRAFWPKDFPFTHQPLFTGAYSMPKISGLTPTHWLARWEKEERGNAKHQEPLFCTETIPMQRTLMPSLLVGHRGHKHCVQYHQQMAQRNRPRARHRLHPGAQHAYLCDPTLWVEDNIGCSARPVCRFMQVGGVGPLRTIPLL